MMKKEKTGKSRLLRRYVVSLVVFMLVLIFVLSAVAASIVKNALMEFGDGFVFTAADALQAEAEMALNQYSRTGTIEDELFDSTLTNALVMEIEWDLSNCYFAVPEEDGLRYLFGTGSALLKPRYTGEGPVKIWDYYTPYPDGVKAWLQTILKGKDKDEYRLFEIWDPEKGHMAVAAMPVYNASTGDLIALAFVECSLAVVDNMLFRAVLILSALIALITIILLVVYYRQTTKHVVVPIQTLNQEALDIKNRLNAGDVYHSNIHTGDEIEELSKSFEQMSCDLRDYISENSRISAERERIATELDMAARIQANQLPSVFPPFPDRTEFDLYASMKPVKEVGGDFYDFFLVDDDHLALVMADVSGKGVPAALFMMVSRALIKNTLKSGYSPEETLKSVNAQLLETNRTKQFVTVWLAVVELSTGRGVASNAGHEHPMLRHAGGDYELVVYKHSPPVAASKRTRFLSHEFTLVPGDTLFVYTDGVTDATDADEELFGTERLVEALNRDPDASPEATVENVSKTLREFVGGADQFDDITMLCLRYNGPGKGLGEAAGASREQA